MRVQAIGVSVEVLLRSPTTVPQDHAAPLLDSLEIGVLLCSAIFQVFLHVSSTRPQKGVELNPPRP